MPLLRSAFIALSHNRPLRRFCEHSALGTRLNARFIAGMRPEDALRVTEAVNRQGISVTLDSLGESVTSPTEAHRAADVYHHLLDSIAERHPLGLGSAADLVGAYSYLAGDASRWTTGSAMVVDGGYSAP